MKIDLANLPDDVNLLRQMFIDLLETFRLREHEMAKQNSEIVKLKQQIAQLRRGLYVPLPHNDHPRLGRNRRTFRRVTVPRHEEGHYEETAGAGL